MTDLELYMLFILLAWIIVGIAMCLNKLDVLTETHQKDQRVK